LTGPVVKGVTVRLGKRVSKGASVGGGRCIPEGCHLHTSRRKNSKSHILPVFARRRKDELWKGRRHGLRKNAMEKQI
jgi:hypothetical protein